MDQVLIVVFAAGVAAGILLIAVGLSLRRSKAGSSNPPDRARSSGPGRTFTFSRTFSAGSSTDAKAAEAAIDEAASLVADTIGRVASAAGVDARTTVTTRVSRSAIRLDGASPTVEVDGVTYVSLADMPADARSLLVDELRLMLDSKMPEPAHSQLEALLATAAAAPETHLPGPDQRGPNA
jgi:hypothetical protein